MKPSYAILRANFHSAGVVKQDALFNELGWDDLLSNPNYKNTCAIRMSFAPVKCGVHVRGGLTILKGVHKGSRIEPGQAKLAKMLAEPSYFGKPEEFSKEEAKQGIGRRKGVVAFWDIPGYMNGRGGHIDLVDGVAEGLCASTCFWTSSRVWFWPLA